MRHWRCRLWLVGSETAELLPVHYFRGDLGIILRLLLADVKDRIERKRPGLDVRTDTVLSAQATSNFRRKMGQA